MLPSPHTNDAVFTYNDFTYYNFTYYNFTHYNLTYNEFTDNINNVTLLISNITFS
jgi:hypothetical protein